MNIRRETHEGTDFRFGPYRQYFGDLSVGVFDIETTGLNPKNAKLILAGLLVPQGDSFVLTQYFAEYPEEEALVLAALVEDLCKLDVVITYNGLAFDLPFLLARLNHHRQAPPPLLYSLDLYRLVDKYTQLRQFLPNLKQKTVEDFMGLWPNRTDEISGKESVSLYYDYLHSGDRALEEKILLHNRDDVLQLHRLLKLLEKVPLHQALFHLGFPVKGKNHKVLVEHIRIQKETLTLSGRQGPNPIRRVSFGDKGTAYDFAPGTFTLSLPLIVHQGLTFLDMEDFPFSLPGTVEGYLVLSGEDGPNYREINYFVKTLLERILNNEL